MDIYPTLRSLPARPRRRWLAPVTALAVILGALTAGAHPAAAETTTITQGSMTWGVKQSWRNYIGEIGISTSGGTSRATDGAFVWPVESGTYDSATKHLDLQLKGSVHFTAHEGALDMTVTSPRLVVDGDEPQLFASVVSKSETTGQLVDYGEIPMVDLDLGSATTDTVGDTTTWTPISTTLTGEGYEAFSRNYPTGTQMDPISATYVGPGGKPVATQETWTQPGSLTYLQTGSHAIANTTSILPDPAHGLVHVATLTSLQAYDIDTWAPVGTALSVGNANYPAAILDQDADAVVMTVSNKLTAYRWNAATTSYAATVLFDGYLAGFGYDRFGHRILAADASTGLRVFTFADDAWTSAVYGLSGIPSGRPQLTADDQGRIAIVDAGSVPKLITITGSTAAMTDLPGDYTNPTASQASYQYPTEIFAPSTGGFMLTNYQGKVYRARPSGTTFVRDVTVRATGLGAVLRASADTSTDTWYLADNTLQTVTAVTDDASGVFKVKDLGYFVLYPIGLSAANGTVYVTATQQGGSNQDYGIRTFDQVGVSPAFTTQPADTTATLDVGVTHQKVTLSAAVTGTPTTTLQWQQRGSATGKFADVPGATSATLEVSAEASMNGRQYRVVATNAAGALASDAATLTVDSAPSTVVDVADQTVVEGTDATFQVMPAGNPYPTITWQRRVNGFWQDVPTDGDDVTVSGGTLTVAATAIDQTGTKLRAKLANTVATVYSRTATLAVEAASTAKRSIASGTLGWGLKQSFRDYVVGPIANGAITVSDGAVRNDDGTFGFAVVDGTYDPTPKHTQVHLGGTVDFTGHAGALALRVSDPTIDITGTSGTLSAEVVSTSLDSGESVDYGRVAVADLDASAGVSVGGGKVTLAGITATLTAAGAPAFAGFYAAGTVLDPLSATLFLGAEVAADAASSVSVRAARTTFGYGETTTVVVDVSSAGGTPTGQVAVTVGGRTLSASLAAGSATVTLPLGLTPGSYPVAAAFPGAPSIAASTGSTTVVVGKAAPRIALALVKATVHKRKHPRLKVVATVPAARSVTAYGQVVVRDGGRVIATRTLKVADDGRATFSLPKLKKGKHKLTVSLVGNSLLSAATSGRQVLRVIR